MSKFCGNCGAQLDDDAVVCSNCGCNIAPAATPASAETENATPGENAVAAIKAGTGKFFDKVKTDSNFRNIVIGIAAGFVALIVLIVVLVSVFGGGYKRAIDNYIDATFYGDYSAYKANIPDAMWDSLKESGDALDKEDYKEQYKMFKEYFEDQYGKNISVDYKVTDEDELDEDDLDDLRDELKSDYGIAKKSVTKAYELEVEFTIEGDDDEDSNEEIITVVKIDGDWYVID